MNKNLLIEKLKPYIPEFIKSKIRSNIPLVDYRIHYRESNNPFLNDSDEMIYPESQYKLGIFKEFYQYHKNYIAACRDLKVSYKLIDIKSPDWQDQMQNSGCDAFLVWPSAGLSIWKEMFDDKIRIAVEDMDKMIYPSVKEVWLFENKNRVQDWLLANDIPQPKTWLFYDQKDALKFAETCELPIVFKTNIGSSSNGVKILRDRDQLVKFIKTAFNDGILPQGHHPLDRNWGRIFFQQYFPDVEEWRMIKIGDSYFGYRKEKVGDFHSGSHHWSWLDPGPQLLEFTKMVMEKGGFYSMDVDVFRDKGGNLYVNELQTVFGASTPKEMLMIDGVEGRYIYDNGQWVFEPGDFSSNQCCNLRVNHVIELLKEKKTSL